MSSSSSELLKLENEYRKEIPTNTRKPQIKSVPKPTALASKVSSFLEKKDSNISGDDKNESTKKSGPSVVMDILMLQDQEG